MLAISIQPFLDSSDSWLRTRTNRTVEMIDSAADMLSQMEMDGSTASKAPGMFVFVSLVTTLFTLIGPL